MWTPISPCPSLAPPLLDGVELLAQLACPEADWERYYLFAMLTLLLQLFRAQLEFELTG
jgi:hypothetical protein